MEKFKDLFTIEDVNFHAHLEDLILTFISVKDNEALCCIPTPEEIKSILFLMHNLKMLGPNDFPVAFYKSYWLVVREAVIKAVTSFFTDGSITKEINSSLIILISKVPNPLSFKKYRPINLCNMIYKIISKILVSRIRPLLHRFISPCQSVFMLGCWIAKNQEIVQELLHSFKVRKIKARQMAIKLVLKKAYDRVNWNFLQATLGKLGFNNILVG